MAGFFTLFADNGTVNLIIRKIQCVCSVNESYEEALKESTTEANPPAGVSASEVDSGAGAPSAKGSAISRVLDILESVGVAARPVTAAELSDELDIPKATIHRLCATLEKQGWLQSTLSGRGMLPGVRFNRISQGVLASSPYHAERHAILTGLSHEIGETCNISIPNGSEMIYFDRAETHWPVRVQLQVGSRVPSHSTASGKLYLSTLPLAKRNRIVKSLRLHPHTGNTIADPQLLAEELELTAKRGFSVDNEEYIEGMVALAVGVTDSQDRLFATLSFHAPSMRVPIDRVESYLPALKSAALKLRGLLED